MIEIVRGIDPTEYAAATGGGLFEPARGLLEVTGPDRASWLNNLVTNTIKPLQPGEGNHAFALNVKGRILTELSMLVLPEAIWIDLPEESAESTAAHLERYHITENLTLTNRSREFGRLVLLGRGGFEVAVAMGVSQVQAMAQLGSTGVPLAGKHRLGVRNDSWGLPAFELFVEAPDLAVCRERLLGIGRPVGLQTISPAAMEVRRIEAGLPRWGAEITPEVLPAETGQLERAVSFQKGCYLGQEIVERMRSRGGLARKLMGLRLSSLDALADPPILLQSGAEVGRLTSVCESPAFGPIALGMVKLAVTQPGSRLTCGGVEATVGPLPFT